MLTLIKHFCISVFLCTICGSNFFHSMLRSTNTNFCDAAIIVGNDLNDLIVTSDEKEALERFSTLMAPILTNDWMKTDFYLLRCHKTQFYNWYQRHNRLRARELNLKQAENMLLQNLRWREANNINDILFSDFSDITGILPASYDCHDKQKRPVVAISLGSWNFQAAAIQGNIQRTHRYYNFLFENVMHEILEAQSEGMNITRARVLVDLEGLNLFSATGMSILLRMQTTLEAYYPRFWEEIIMINAPTGSRILWMSIQPLLSKQTQEIFRIFDNKKAVWMAYLDQRIERDQRYKNFGGTKVFRM